MESDIAYLNFLFFFLEITFGKMTARGEFFFYCFRSIASNYWVLF